MHLQLPSRRLSVALVFLTPLVACLPNEDDPGLCSLPGLPDEVVAPYRWALHVGDSLVIIEGAERRAVPAATGLTTFAWAHDGLGLLFTRGDSLYRLDGPEGEARLLSAEWAQIRFPAESPDGSGVALSVNRSEDPGTGWELVVLRPDEGAVTRLGHGYDAAWAPDGSTLYYEVHEPASELWRFDVARGEGESLGLDSQRDRTVEVAPSGRELAFTRGLGALMLHSLDRGETVRLTGERPHDRFASFSADGSLVLFYRQDESDGVAFSIVACEIATGRTVEVATGPVQAAVFAPAPAG